MVGWVGISFMMFDNNLINQIFRAPHPQAAGRESILACLALVGNFSVSDQGAREPIALFLVCGVVVCVTTHALAVLAVNEGRGKFSRVNVTMVDHGVWGVWVGLKTTGLAAPPADGFQAAGWHKPHS